METIHPFTKYEVHQILNARFKGESLQIVADRFNTTRVLIRRVESEYMKNVGITSAGAGAGGLLGHYLHGALADEENPSTLGYLASTLGGAGLGGAASYFGGLWLEEYLFFIFVPLAALMTIEAVLRVKPHWSKNGGKR